MVGHLTFTWPGADGLGRMGLDFQPLARPRHPQDDLLYLVSVLHNDGDQTTGASLRGNHLTLDLGEDSVRLDRVVDDLGRQNLLQAMEDYVLL